MDIYEHFESCICIYMYSIEFITMTQAERDYCLLLFLSVVQKSENAFKIYSDICFSF